ncbi:hypothetical protein D3C72_1835830 [compost metagenome]
MNLASGAGPRQDREGFGDAPVLVGLADGLGEGQGKKGRSAGGLQEVDVLGEQAFDHAERPGSQDVAARDMQHHAAGQGPREGLTVATGPVVEPFERTQFLDDLGFEVGTA